MATLAEAVNHAHQRGVIHRDLKPANIMLNGDLDSQDTAASPLCSGLRIADFGLAKHATKTDALETTEGAIVGTPAYMSPEQARGESQIENGTDIYSLGVILYELLTGKVPVLKSTNIDTLLAINSSEIRASRKLNPEIPRDLESICLKCLNKSTADRYATAMELAADLNRWLSGEVVHARRVTQIERAFKWCARNAIVALLMATLAVASIFSIWQWRQSSVNFELATMQAKRAEKQKSFAESQTLRAEHYLQSMTDIVDKFLLDVEQYGDPALIPKSQRNRLEEILNLQRSLVAEEKSSDTIRENTIRTFRRIGRIHSALGQNDQAIQLYREVDQRLGDGSSWSPQGSKELDPEFLKLVFDLKLDQFLSLKNGGDLEEAGRVVDWMLEVRDQYGHVLDRVGKLIYGISITECQGLIENENHQFEASLRLHESSLPLGVELMGLDDSFKASEVVISNLLNLASVAQRLQKEEYSIGVYSDAQKLIEGALQTDPDNMSMRNLLVVVNSNWANSLTTLGQFDGIESKLKRSIELLEGLAEEVPRNQEFRLAIILNTQKLAGLYQRTNRSDLANATIDRGIELTRINSIGNSPKGKTVTLQLYETKVHALRKLKGFDEAIELAEEAIQLGESYLADSPNAALTTTVSLIRSIKMITIYGHRSPEEFLDDVPSCYQALNDSLRMGGPQRDMNICQDYVAILRGCEAISLAKLERWSEAVETCKTILEIERQFRSRQSLRYFDAAKIMAKILTYWRTSEKDLGPEFEGAVESTLDWLALAVSENFFDDLTRLVSSKQFDELRSLERYQDIVSQIKERDSVDRK